MIRTLAAAALLLGLMQEKPAQEPDGAKAGKTLFDRVEAKIRSAKSVRIALKGTLSLAMGMGRGGGEGEKEKEFFSGEVLFRNPLEVRMKLKGPEGEVLVRSDGKRVLVEGEMSSEVQPTIPREPKELIDVARSLVTRGIVSMPRGDRELLGSKEPSNFFLGGREKVGDVETRLIQYDLAAGIEELDRIAVRAWIDTTKLAIVKREYDFRSLARLTETITSVVLDEDLPADEFAFQSASALKTAIEAQIARSVEVFARFMGRLPATLDELDAAPRDAAPSSFWPEGGYWLGGKRPAVAYAVKDGVARIGDRTVAAPVEGRIRPSTARLKEFYTARVRLHLMHAAVEAWHRAYCSIPENLAQLNSRPKEIEFWPEGGFVSAASLKDPWGDAWKFEARPGGGIISCASKNRHFREKQLTPEELKALRSGAFAEGAPESKKALEAILEKYVGGGIEESEAAAKELIGMGLPALAAVEDRLDGAGKGEAAARLRKIRELLQASTLSWRRELVPLTIRYPATPAGRRGSLDENEGAAVIGLKTITTAQADFRSNDRDGNRISDFWVRDVAGLYGIVGATGESTECRPAKEGEGNFIKLIERDLAAADATDGRWEYGVLGVSEPEPFHGYLFAALKKGVLGGAAVVYMEGENRADMFGYIAYPAEYGVTGKYAFMVNEDNTVWKKDLAGETVDTFPAAPAAEGWSKVD